MRSFFVCLFALLVMGIWIEFEECFNVGGPLAENSPPNSAIGVILLVIIVLGALYYLRKSLRLSPAELVFIYTALLVAAPLMTQGMWHRFFALTTPIIHKEDWKTLESFPPGLWPHGDNLCDNGLFQQRLRGYTTTGAPITWEPVAWKGNMWTCPVLSNGSNPAGITTLSYQFHRRQDGRELLVPGEHFLFNCLVKAEGLQGNSSYAVQLRPDNGQMLPVWTDNKDTKPTFAIPSGFTRIGKNAIAIPDTLKDTLTLQFNLTGPGKLIVQDIQFMNIESIEGAFTGRQMVRADHLSRLRPNERNFLSVKPTHMFSLAGLKYLLTAFIPWEQWWRPLLAWFVLIFALFLGFLGFNVLMRKQWAEHERFTFPMNILPRLLLSDDTDETGAHQSIFRNKILWIGFAVTLPLVILKGIHYYYPQVPGPMWGQDIWSNAVPQFVNNPLLKAFFAHAYICIIFCILAIALLIETDILFTVWFSFLLYSLLYLFGKQFNFNKYAGYPWDSQQSIGSFIAYAVLAIVAARSHLVKVIKHIFGRIKLDESAEIMPYRWALFLIFASLALIAAWGVWTKMGLCASLLFFGYVLICGFAAGKIRAECGAPYGYWMPYMSMAFLGALGGFASFGTTGMLLAVIASGFMMTACFLFIAPIQVEMMELGRHLRVKPRHIGHGLTFGLIGGVLLGGFILLSWSYGIGGQNMKYQWPYDQGWYMNGYRAGETAADSAQEKHELVKPANAPLNIVRNPVNVDAKGITIGLVITGVLTLCRSLFTWFPLHPLGYLLATTVFSQTMWFTCFVAWLIRLIVLRIGGAHTIRKGLVPFCIGMFLACMLSIVLFDGIGIYLRSHGITDVYSSWP